MKLMIVDDNPRIRKVIREILSNTFDEFLEHNDGEGASLLYQTFNPDWVVMDIKMIEVDGIEATKEIIKKHPAAKIVIVSHFADKETQNEALMAGAKLFISKENLTELTEVF
ncbi:MAG: response regulator [Ignavibacteriae bacterium]|nr:response regulator [Ignavibacteriota bacterium]